MMDQKPDYKESLTLALAKTREEMLKHPDTRRVWMAALAVHVRQGGGDIDGQRPMLGDLLALEITREELKMEQERQNKRAKNDEDPAG